MNRARRAWSDQPRIGSEEHHQSKTRHLYAGCRNTGQEGDAVAVTATKPKVIVIDDQPVIADTLAEILNQNGYDAVALHSGEEALNWATHSQPAIVLSDIRMHKISGIQAAVHIRSLYPRCRIILFSASAITEREQAAIDESGFEFLHRPLHPNEVLNQLHGRTNGRVLPFLPPHRL